MCVSVKYRHRIFLLKSLLYNSVTIGVKVPPTDVLLVLYVGICIFSEDLVLS